MNDGFFWVYLEPFLIGSLSGAVATAITQPIDTIKVIIQSKR
jgi:hypothetical protein